MSRRLTATWPASSRDPADRPGAAELHTLLTGTGARVVDGDRRLDGPTLDEAARRLAGALADRGVTPGDTVAWQSHNRWEAVALYRACWALGAVAAPIHHQASPVEVAALVARLDPALVVDPDEVEGLVERGTPDAAAGATASGRSSDDLAVVLHTSGSSGVPKGVLHTHGGLAHKASLMIDVHQLTPDDVILMPAPLAHVSGLQNAVTVAGAAGMGVVLMARWDPEAALELVEEHGVTFMIGPPTFFVSLRAAPGFSSRRVDTIRLISCGGAGVTPAFVDDTAAAFGATVKRTYGSTEAPTVTTSHAGDDPDRARDTDGRPTGTVRLRLGPSDEVWVRGPELFAGYDDPARTAEAVTPDGWFRTGDVGRIERDGRGRDWLTIVGRIKDIIIRGGENIAASEVEAALDAHPGVRQAIAVGQPDDRLGERVCAFVVCEPGAAVDVEECRRWFAALGVARFKTPERVVVVDELPVLAAGKVDRAELARRAAREAALRG